MVDQRFSMEVSRTIAFLDTKFQFYRGLCANFPAGLRKWAGKDWARESGGNRAYNLSRYQPWHSQILLWNYCSLLCHHCQSEIIRIQGPIVRGFKNWDVKIDSFWRFWMRFWVIFSTVLRFQRPRRLPSPLPHPYLCDTFQWMKAGAAPDKRKFITKFVVTFLFW